jgi:mono/diheme cytochrome c family protein
LVDKFNSSAVFKCFDPLFVWGEALTAEKMKKCVFLRSLAPVRNPLPPTKIIFPVSYLIRNAPAPITSAVPEPDTSTPVNRGRYLVEIAGCADCHTPQKRGQPLPGMNFAGGFIFEGPWGRVASAYRGLADPDLLAIFSYLRTMPAGFHNGVGNSMRCPTCNSTRTSLSFRSSKSKNWNRERLI